MRHVLRLLLPILLAAGPAMAFEDPPVVSAESVLGAQARGPNYTVESEVGSDGLLRLFQMRTAFGTYDIAGEGLMRERIREMAALRKLQAMSESDVFVKSLGQAAAAPLKFGSDLITAPGATLKRSASGLANMFDRVGSAMSNESANRDSVAGSVLGVDSARRQLAVQLGVDPYTDFPPLSAKLQDIATASAFGGLSMKGLMMAIPGGAGVVVSSASTADTIRSTLAEKTSSQIVDKVRGTLARLKVPGATIARFVDNRVYTPTDLLLMSEALAKLKSANSGLFLARAAEASTREEAYFQRRRAILLASNAKSLGIGPFVGVGGFPLNRLSDGRLIALFPLDELAWTERVATLFNRVQGIGGAGGGAPVLALTGTVTPMAEAEIMKLGWTIERLR
jgi:hypothetical protein